MSEDTNTALLKTIAAGMEDLRRRVGRMEDLMTHNAEEVALIKGNLTNIETRVDEWVEKTEPVTKAYSDVPKIMRGVIATISVVAVVLTTWWSGGISAVMKFLTHPPVQP